MKNLKRELLNEVVTGLMVAATFATVMPIDALAQNLSQVGNSAGANVMVPFVEFAGYVAYALGAILIVAGIAACKRHADNPNSEKLAPALGRLGAGAAFLIAPSVGNMLTGTGNNLGITGTTSFTGFGGYGTP